MIPYYEPPESRYTERVRTFVGYPWPDMTDKRIKTLEAEVTRLREGWMRSECKSMCFDSFAGYWYRPGDCKRKCTDGNYCQAVIDRVGVKQ